MSILATSSGGSFVRRKLYVPTRPVMFVAASGTIYATTTSQIQTIPASVEEGDLLLAFIMHRSALTPAADWLLVASATTSAIDITQYTSVYKRIALSGDAGGSTTWSQAASARLAVHIQAYRRGGGCNVINSSTASEDAKDTLANVMNWSSLTSSVNGAIGIASASSILAWTAPRRPSSHNPRAF